MEGRAGYFPLALKAAMTHEQESCTLPKGFPCTVYKLPDRRGNNFSFHLLLLGKMWCDASSWSYFRLSSTLLYIGMAVTMEI